MKKFEFIVAALALVAGVMFCSCVKDETDMLPLHDQHQIDFTASSDAEWLNATRADEEKEPQVMILELEGDEDLEQPLYLHITCEDRKEPTAEELGIEATRGTVITTDNIAQKYGTNGFGLFAYVYKGEWNDSRTSDYIHNDTVRYHTNTGKWHVHNYVEKNANGKPAYTPEDYYFWPGKNYNVRFFAYAPHDAHYGLCILNIPESPYIGAPDIDFLLSNNNIDQFDLCVAKTEQYSGDHNQTVALNFKHVLSAIDFVADEYMPKGVINNIWLVNMLRQDNYNFETGKWAGVEQYAGSKDIQFKSNYTVTLPGNKKTKVTDTSTNSTFFVIPHELANNAAIQIAFTPEGSSKIDTLRTKLPKMTWEMGKHYTITISPKVVSSQYVLEVTAPNKTKANYLGIVDGHATSHWTTGNVVSYRIDYYRYGLKEPEKVPVKWRTMFSVKTGEDTWSDWTYTRPAMFPKFTAGGNGCLDTAEEPDKYGADFAPIVPKDDLNPFGAKEREEDNEVVDLYATNNSSTANCYVINKAGTYTFPLIYGNAITGGNNNPNSYSGATFVDYNGIPITSPAISGSIKEAKLLWCDAPQLVTDVSLSNTTTNIAGYDVKTITFQVPGLNLTPGNAVIALYDTSGKIMWSWHIWVTKWNPNIGVNETDDNGNKHAINVTSSNTTFTFANQLLGYAPARKATWEARNVRVKFVQVETENGKEVVKNESSAIEFSQTGFATESSEGNMPYYQWGRKDPLLPYNYVTDSDGIVVLDSSSEKTCFFQGDVNLTSDILKVWNSVTETYVDYPYSSYFKLQYVVGTSSSIDYQTSIQNPTTFYGRSKSTAKAMDGAEYDWCKQTTINRWDATNEVALPTLANEKKTVKTIYDPCPAGWCVPPSGAFYGFTSAGGATAGKAIYTTTSGLGLYSKDNTRTFYFSNIDLAIPITGDRNRYNGAPWWDARSPRTVQVWTSTPTQYDKDNNGTYEYTNCAIFASSHVNKDGSTTGLFNKLTDGKLARSSGFAILPVKEH